MLKQLQCLSLAFGALSGPALAAQEVNYPATGTVDYINVQHNAIVIDDSSYVLPSSVSVHSAGGNISRGSLRKGARIGFRTQPRGQASVITEIWVLP